MYADFIMGIATYTNAIGTGEGDNHTTDEVNDLFSTEYGRVCLG